MWEAYWSLWMTPSCDMTALMSVELYSPLLVVAVILSMVVAWRDAAASYFADSGLTERPSMDDIRIIDDVVESDFKHLTERDQAFLMLLRITRFWEPEQCDRFDRLVHVIKTIRSQS